MALVTLTTLASTLTTKFESMLVNQIERSTPLMLALPAGDGVTGKRVDWGVKFGTSVGAGRAEGADVVGDGNNDNKIPATLEFGNYDDHFSITGKAIRAAAAAGNPAQLAMLFEDELGDSGERLAKGIAGALYTGTGATNFIHGLTASSGPLAATGTYANIDRSTYPQWASNLYSNSGVPRALDKPLMRRVRRGIYEASGQMPDLIVCSPGVHEAYGNTFDQERRYLDNIRLRGQEIKLDGGYAVLEFDGIPVIMDNDCPDGDMLFLNTRFLKVVQLPDVGAGNPAMRQMKLRGTSEEQYGDRSSKISARVNPLARSGDKVIFQLISYLALQSKRCNAHARLTDIAQAA